MHERASRAARPKEIAQHVQNLRMQDGGRLEVLSRGGGPGEDKDSRTDDGADAERSQRPWPQGFLETMSGLVGVGNQLINRFAT